MPIVVNRALWLDDDRHVGVGMSVQAGTASVAVHDLWLRDNTLSYRVLAIAGIMQTGELWMRSSKPARQATIDSLLVKAIRTTSVAGLGRQSNGPPKAFTWNYSPTCWVRAILLLCVRYLFGIMARPVPLVQRRLEVCYARPG